MAVRRTCDACGSATDVVERGRIVKRDYCAACVDPVDEYLMALDAAHTQAAQMFAELERAAAKRAGIRDLPV